MTASPVRLTTPVPPSIIDSPSVETTSIEATPIDLPEGLSALPPTQYDLPSCDDIPMETQRHKLQMDLLIETCQTWLWAHRPDSYVNGNMFVYFSMDQVKNRDYRGPDFFVALDVAPTERLSWVCWEEGQSPDIVIELLSPSTAETDKTTKFEIYQTQMRVPEYIWYDPFNPEDFAGFTLQNRRYQPIAIDENGLLSQSLGLRLLKWTGDYQGVSATWIRWATAAGQLILTQAERAAQESQRAEQESQRAEQESQRADQESQRADEAEARAEQESQRADRLAAKLRELGIEE
jgi:Uma2 family endonuclease